MMIYTANICILHPKTCVPTCGVSRMCEVIVKLYRTCSRIIYTAVYAVYFVLHAYTIYKDFIYKDFISRDLHSI